MRVGRYGAVAGRECCEWIAHAWVRCTRSEGGDFCEGRGVESSGDIVMVQHQVSL